MGDFVLEKQIVTHMTKKCDTCNNAFLELFPLNCIFVQNIGTVLLASLFLKQIMYCLLVILWETFFSLLRLKWPKLLFLFNVTHVTLFQHTPAKQLLG